ncbi:MAG: GNAT family N-acetyltransferase [Idiomarina sp.]|nr:GNAT family N-acetyltransferase [Idiomarina sp.]
MYRLFLKRTIDLVLATIGFILLSPIFIIVMVGLSFANRGTPFFFQERPGKNEKFFRIIKFKSMTDTTDENGKLLPDNERLTRMGALVRKTSLDELPQLINVIKGDMSLVGPRPLLKQYLPHYTSREKARHLIRPGITGLAQVTGRNSLTWDEKLELDVRYVENVSFKIDLGILCKTVLKVFSSKNVNILPSSRGTLLSIARTNEYILRPLCEKDLPYRVEWLNDSRIYQSMNLQLPITMSATRSWFQRVTEDNSRVDLVLTHNGIPIAMAGLTGAQHGECEQYTFVNPEMKGQGIGSMTHFMRLVYGFDIFGATLIKSVIDIDNIASRKSVERMGFALKEIKKGELEKNGLLVDRCYYFCTKESFNRSLFGYKIEGGNVKYTHRRG